MKLGRLAKQHCTRQMARPPVLQLLDFLVDHIHGRSHAGSQSVTDLPESADSATLFAPFHAVRRKENVGVERLALKSMPACSEEKAAITSVQHECALPARNKDLHY